MDDREDQGGHCKTRVPRSHLEGQYGEPALVQVLENVKLAREAPSIIQHSPAYDPQANRAAEKAVQDYMGQVRAMKIGLEWKMTQGKLKNG